LIGIGLPVIQTILLDFRFGKGVNGYNQWNLLQTYQLTKWILMIIELATGQFSKIANGSSLSGMSCAERR
jgi:hypothetical protein